MGREGFTTFTAQKRGSSALSFSATTLPTTATAVVPKSRASPLNSPSANTNRPIKKTFKNLKLTLLCGLITILVMRGTIRLAGPSNWKSASAAEEELITEDYAEEVARVLAAIRSDEPEDEAATFVNPNANYSLGPKIADWDDKRQAWLHQNPSFPNLVNGRPRVMLVTGSQPKPCDNPVGNHYLVKSLKNKIDYCRIHDIEIVYNMAHLDPVLDSFWAKLPLIRKLMLSHPEVEWIWWMDSDAMFTDMSFRIPFDKYEGYNMVVHGYPDLLKQKSWIALNAGVFLIRNCQWSLDLIDAWVLMGPKGAVREASGRLLTASLKGRPAFEGDDQSALIYLLLTEQERWMGKMFLESSYHLHGYWLEIVDRYEEMIEKHHPGLGDERWPLVTHFVGCKPCGTSYATYAQDRCLKSMERAFNFADNQVLELYGFRHRGLLNPKIKKIRNETATPLEIVDRFDIRHSSMKSRI